MQTKPLGVRLTPEEREVLDLKAKAAGMTTAAWAKAVLLGEPTSVATPQPVPPAVNPKPAHSPHSAHPSVAQSWVPNNRREPENLPSITDRPFGR